MARKTREEAEARVQQERKAREVVEARIAKEARAREVLQAKMLAERKARAEAEDRAKAEAIARVMQANEFKTRSATEVKEQVQAELKARQKAELDADVQARQDAKVRAEESAARRIEEEQAAAKSAEVKQKSARILKIAAIALAVLLLACIGLLLVLPLTPWTGNVEKLIAERIGEPATIGSMRFSLAPAPQLKLENVALGKGQGVKINTLLVPIGIGTLSGDRKELDHVQLQGGSIDQDVLPRLAGWAANKGANQALSIERISAADMRLGLSGMEPLSINAEAKLGRGGEVQKATVKTTDGKASIELIPKGDTAALVITARAFTLPVEPRVTLDSLQANAIASAREMTISEYELTVFGGTVKGSARLRHGNNLSAEGNFSARNLSVNPLLSAFGVGPAANGTIEMKGSFELAAASYLKIFTSPRVAAGFNVQHGILLNADLLRAIQAPLRDGVRGGKTPFDELSGTVQVAGDRVAFRQLRLASKLLSAYGVLDVAAGDLSGRVNIDVGSRNNIIARGTVTVGGSLKEPVLLP
jgi:hypothetical protein